MLPSHFIPALVTYLLIIFSTDIHAITPQILSLYNNGEFQQSYFLAKNMAVTGNKDSQYLVGIMTLRGEYVEKNAIESYGWIKLSAEDGNEKYVNIAAKVYDSLDTKSQTAAIQTAEALHSKYGKNALSIFYAPRLLPDDECEPEPKQLVAPRIKYPRTASTASRVTIGSADVVFTLSAQGYARDISAIKKTRDDFFLAAAKGVIKGRWEPKKSSGALVPYREMQYRVSFSGINGAKVHIKNGKERISALLGKAKAGDPEAQFQYASTLEYLKSYENHPSVKGLDLEYQAANKWLLQSARQGHARSQYELGKNMLAGKGCEVDAKTANQWLTAAASAGHPFAQEKIAMSQIPASKDKEEKMIYWLRKAANTNYYKAKLFLAWTLSTSDNPNIRDHKESITLLEEEPSLYFDGVRIDETKAAAFAEAGDFKNAVKYQKLAIKAAKKLGWDIPVLSQRMKSYKTNSPWRGVYHESVAI